MEKSKSLSKNHNNKNRKNKDIYPKSDKNNEWKKIQKKNLNHLIMLLNIKNIIYEDEQEKIILNEIK